VATAPAVASAPNAVGIAARGPNGAGAGAPVLPAAAAAAALDEAPRPVTFTLRAPGARRVALVGDFNRWDPAATPLAGRAGAWSVEVPLAPGRHAYAFVVDGGRWTLDPAAPSERDPDFGRARSVVVVGLEARP
jgi:1,4-alpha-glucan branching enzyme